VTAQLAVILIGVNNLGNGHSPEETLRGVVAVAQAVQDKLPQARIVLLSILPAGETKNDELRLKVTETNKLIAAQQWPKRVTLNSVGDEFLESDGHIEKSMMADFLHPTQMGYERLTAAVGLIVDQALSHPDHR
jgi:N-acetylglucosamine-6-sulfatase/beta-glucosidase